MNLARSVTMDRVNVPFNFKPCASLVAQSVKTPPAMQENWVQSLAQEYPLEKGMATHSSILVWEIHRQRSLVGCNPWGCKELDMTD